MSYFEMQHNNRPVVRFGEHEVERFMGAIDYALQIGESFIVSIARTASRIIERVNEIFRKHSVEIVVKADSDPDAAEYVINALVGATAGGAVGAVGGAVYWGASATWANLAATSFVVPGIGPCIAIPAGVMAFIGAVAGLAVTKWGLRVRFSPVDPNRVSMEFTPAGS